MEQWKQYRETNYEVSNLGQVRNKETKRIISQHKKYSGKKENDYMKVNIDRKQVSVHRMVAECFIENPDNLPEVNHKNGIKYDNRVENLEWCSREENYQDAIRRGSNNERKPVKCIKLGETEEIYFDSLWKAAKYLKELRAKDITIDHYCNNIKQNIIGKTKYAYGYVWKFVGERNEEARSKGTV